MIIFFDHIGRTISSIEIIGRGEVQLTTLCSNLADGIYTYSLIVNDASIDTKKMVKQTLIVSVFEKAMNEIW